MDRKLKDLQKRWRHFQPRASIVGCHAIAGIALARAEVEFERRGWSLAWEWDADGMPDDGKCTCGCGHEIETCEGAILHDAEGNVLASLWGIWDADDDYRRDIRAELASEALHTIQTRDYQGAIATAESLMVAP